MCYRSLVLRRANTRAAQAWDACERTTRNPSASADGALHTRFSSCLRTHAAEASSLLAAVVIFSVLRRAGEAPHTLLVRQYRPPVSAFFVLRTVHGSHRFCCLYTRWQA